MKIKKLIISFIILVYIFEIISFADEEIIEENLDEIYYGETYETISSVSNEPLTYSKNIIAIDRKTLNILYEKNAYDVVPMASTTKIMTCILAIEKCSLNETVTISKNAASINGSTLGITENMQISMSDLLYGLMLLSGNDCAIAIAEHISGSIQNFAELMNNKAKELGLNNTHFVTPHGLDNDNHYTTAYELAILTDYALKNETFKNIVSTKKYTISLNGFSRELSNTNELLGNLNGVYGVKTGFTFNAGRCLVSSSKRNNMDIIVVVLGADTKNIRTKDSINVINYVFNNFSYINTYDISQTAFSKYLKYFEKNYILYKTVDKPLIEIEKKDNYEYPIKKDDILKFSTQIYTITNFSSEINKGSKIGILTLYNNDKILYSLDITIVNQLEQNTWYYYFKYMLKNFLIN